MAFFEDEYKPPFTYQGHPVYWTQVGGVVTFVFFVLGGLLLGLDHAEVFEYTGITERAFPQVWRLFTYPIFEPDYYGNLGFLWLLFVMAIFFIDGYAVERHVGGKVFLQLCFFALVIPALVVAIFSQLFPFIFLYGMLPIAFAILVAHATIFPGGDIWGSGISRAFFIFLLVIVNTVLLFTSHDLGGIVGLWMGSVVGYFSMRFAGSGKGMDFIVDWIERLQEARHQKQVQLKVVKKQVVEASLDSVLEKISQRGMASLTPAERAVLQKASSELQKRDRL